jgi:hypothetical protein
MCVCHMFRELLVAYLVMLRRNLISCGHARILDFLAVNRAGLEFKDRLSYYGREVWRRGEFKKHI